MASSKTKYAAHIKAANAEHDRIAKARSDNAHNTDVENHAAQQKVGWYSDDAMMTQVGKERTITQQQGMRAKADRVESTYEDKKVSKK